MHPNVKPVEEMSLLEIEARAHQLRAEAFKDMLVAFWSLFQTRKQSVVAQSA